MMDLGATICTPRAPACLACPITSLCEAASQGDPARYPVKAVKKARPTRRGKAYWVESSGQVWLVRRPEKGLLGGMTALPTSDWAESESALAAQPPCPGQWRRADEPIIHVFTHFRLELAVDRLDLARRPPDEEMERLFGPGQWWPVKTLKDAGLPTLFAKAAQTAGLMDRKQSKAA
jgi:A/G-specific adenine glycosylase